MEFKNIYINIIIVIINDIPVIYNKGEKRILLFWLLLIEDIESGGYDLYGVKSGCKDLYGVKSGGYDLNGVIKDKYEVIYDISSYDL